MTRCCDYSVSSLHAQRFTAVSCSLFKTRQAKLIPQLYKKQATTGDWLVLDLSNNHVLPQVNTVDPV
jgi:hypothetical protein